MRWILRACILLAAISVAAASGMMGVGTMLQGGGSGGRPGGGFAILTEDNSVLLTESNNALVTEAHP